MYTQENISISAASGAAGMKGPSAGRRPGTTGSRGGDYNASGRTSRDAGGCFAADQAVLRPVGVQGNSELSRPGASGEEVGGGRLQGIRNGGAAASAAANGEDVRQRLPVVSAVIRRKSQAQTVRFDGADSSSEESSEGSEGADLNEGAAACAAAIEAVNCELRELQDRTVELVLERRRLESMRDAIDAEIMQHQDAVNEDAWEQEQQQRRQQDAWEQMERLEQWSVCSVPGEEAVISVQCTR